MGKNLHDMEDTRPLTTETLDSVIQRGKSRAAALRRRLKSGRASSPGAPECCDIAEEAIDSMEEALDALQNPVNRSQNAVAEETTPVSNGAAARRTRKRVPQLSEREEEVLRLVAEGYTNKEIGERLSLSVKTVETYKARSMEKLDLDNRAAIVRYALSSGWLLNGTKSIPDTR